MATATPRCIAITPGEPAGIGPDLVVQLAQLESPAQLVAVADPDLLSDRATHLGLSLTVRHWRPDLERVAHEPGTLWVAPVALATASQPGVLNPANAGYVIETLRLATDLCLSGAVDAITTAPVHKGVINDAGIPFSGHTEFLAERTGTQQVVMMLVGGTLRVALVTTHLPLSAVPAAITEPLLAQVLRILHRDLQGKFGIPDPRILVLGLNPHAGESGHLGREEIDVIAPCLARLQTEGLRLTGPVPADTAFTPKLLDATDAVLAMYHDQGLPVLKYQSFGNGVNVTLGLPIIRTSVDHGTALELAGTGRADGGSLAAALTLAISLAAQQCAQPGVQQQ